MSWARAWARGLCRRRRARSWARRGLHRRGRRRKRVASRSILPCLAPTWRRRAASTALAARWGWLRGGARRGGRTTTSTATSWCCTRWTATTRGGCSRQWTATRCLCHTLAARSACRSSTRSRRVWWQLGWTSRCRHTCASAGSAASSGPCSSATPRAMHSSSRRWPTRRCSSRGTTLTASSVCGGSKYCTSRWLADITPPGWAAPSKTAATLLSV
mmetsp:Transcript_11543/g.35685  ORF Transcript_11543/g.35685 Transcript_11543/m.35685 type:complete len:216 (+) Transcript_11543:389-1036(+)